MLSTRLLPLLILALLAGCGSKHSRLNVKSLDNSVRLDQSFGLSAMARDQNGDYDLVLVSQGLEQRRSIWSRTASALNPVSWFRDQPAGQPLTPAAGAPVRQVIHLKIHWRPRAGASPENPAASNATVRWVVFGTPEPSTTTEDIVEYQGTAFARPFFERGGYTVVLQAGRLKLARLSGQMNDPLGPSTFRGKFFVRDDAYTVATVLADLPPPAQLAAPAKQNIPVPTPNTRPTGRR